MTELWLWMTNLGNSKTAAAILFMATFICICLYLYVFAGKKQKKNYDDARYIALLDDLDLTDLDAQKQAFLDQERIQNNIKANDTKNSTSSVK